MTTATKLNREGVSFIEKTHIVKRMSPKCHLKEDISRSFKLLTLPTPTQRRANTLTVIIDSTKPLVDDKWWPRGRHWKGKHNRRRARTREHAKRRRRMHTNLNANPKRTRRTQKEIEKGNARSKDILKKKNWWLWSLIKGNEDALHKKIQRQCSCSIQCQLHCSVVCGKICHIHANNLKLAIERRRKHKLGIEHWGLAIGGCPIVGYKVTNPTQSMRTPINFGVVWDWTRYRHGEPRLVDGIALSSRGCNLLGK